MHRACNWPNQTAAHGTRAIGKNGGTQRTASSLRRIQKWAGPQQPAHHSLGRSSVVVDFDPDGLWLGDFLLSQRDGQDAALVLGLNFVHIHAIGQREGAHKGAVAALDPVVAPAVLL